MTNPLVQSPADFIQYRCLSTGESFKDIWPVLADVSHLVVHPENHENNTLSGLLHQHKWKPVLRDLVPVYPDTEWNEKTNRINKPHFTSDIQPATLHTFVNEAALFFHGFEGKKIGVQLSGGLDSSVIIGLLKHLEIPHGLVGLEMPRYEFRTERRIQQILAEVNDSVALINHEGCLPLAHIKNLPAHQYPDLSSNNFASNKNMAQACEELGIEILLTGMGGDVILGGECPSDPTQCDWRLNCFTDWWLNQYVYKPHGVTTVPFYGQPKVVSALYNLRRGQKEDIPKKWARNYFRQFLPNELTVFTYCADFWGLYIDGLRNAIPTAKKLNDLAHEITGLEYFSESNYDKVFSEDLLECEKTTYQKIESRISISAWLNSLFERDLVRR